VEIKTQVPFDAKNASGQGATNEFAGQISKRGGGVGDGKAKNMEGDESPSMSQGEAPIAIGVHKLGRQGKGQQTFS
jgi:hypothetical protein